MTEVMTAASLWMLRQAATLPDTIYTRQIASVPSAWDRAISIASGLLTLGILVFVAAAVPAAWSLRKSYKRVGALVDRLSTELTPLLRQASAIADNVNYVTTSVRADVQRVNATIANANDRLQQAVEITERRLNEFSALLAVVQEEAERMFVATAATVHGVRTGASALTDEAGPNFAHREDRGSRGMAADEERTIEEEETNGNEHDITRAEDDLPRPRVRPRAGRRGDDEWGWA